MFRSTAIRTTVQAARRLASPLTTTLSTRSVPNVSRSAHFSSCTNRNRYMTRSSTFSSQRRTLSQQTPPPQEPIVTVPGETATPAIPPYGEKVSAAELEFIKPNPATSTPTSFDPSQGLFLTEAQRISLGLTKEQALQLQNPTIATKIFDSEFAKMFFDENKEVLSQTLLTQSENARRFINLETIVKKNPTALNTLMSRFGSLGPGTETLAPENQIKVSWSTIRIVLGLTVGLVLYLKFSDTQAIAHTEVMNYQVAGTLDIGGDFHHLVDQLGRNADSEQYRGSYPLIYFGFTNCPDICPTELTKMMKALDIIEATNPTIYRHIKPIFISVDPLRDTIQRLLEYSKQFHSRIRWLTGSYDDLLDVSKKFRVYFSIPDDATPDSDYNVDHSIFFFLMDRQGKLLNYYGQNKTAEEIAQAMASVIAEDLERPETKQ